MYEPDDLFVVETPAWHVEPTGTSISCIDYSQDGALVAFSNQLGTISVASSYDGDVKRTLEQANSTYPITGLRFHPSEDSLLLSTSRDGTILLYNLPRSEVVNRQRHLGSNLLSMNIDSFGEVFAIACADGSIRIYDLENLQRTKALVKMTAKTATTQTINIYSLVFHPEDSNVIIAAGWSDKVIIWDIRTGNPERSIAGPHVRGPALDIHNDLILAGSSRDKKQLELFDYGTAKKIRDVSIDQTLANGSISINAAKIARNGMDIIAGGVINSGGGPLGSGGPGGGSVVQAFDFTHGKCFGQTPQMQGAVTAAAVSPFGSGFVVGTEAGELACHMVRLKPT
ncbi:hypothetical protein TRFO_02228 [Tritrichomonas foetus]|uniref:Uncharacterized protein n=1 Tax=Tritrichomonas foetus TaxID=1144522 RepID=A0A1J4JAI6_9EUKA|nr:hypothetical protein TRFO_02228 [Tritrichomonas foetus]|eukprot:OHS95247.1 hypothetical protein TRFO_02228 [Tritrichomonas foetus]